MVIPMTLVIIKLHRLSYSVLIYSSQEIHSTLIFGATVKVSAYLGNICEVVVVCFAMHIHVTLPSTRYAASTCVEFTGLKLTYILQQCDEEENQNDVRISFCLINGPHSRGEKIIRDKKIVEKMDCIFREQLY